MSAKKQSSKVAVMVGRKAATLKGKAAAKAAIVIRDPVIKPKHFTVAAIRRAVRLVAAGKQSG